MKKMRRSFLSLINIIKILPINYKYRMAFVLLASFVVAGCDISTLIIAKIIFSSMENESLNNNVINAIDKLSIGNYEISLEYGIIIVVILLCIGAFTKGVCVLGIQRNSAHIATYVGNELFMSILNNSMTWHEQTNEADKLSLLTKDLDRFYFSLNAACQTPVSVVSALVIMGYALSISLKESIFVFTSLIMSITAMYLISIERKRYEGKRLARNFSSLIDVSKDAFSMIRDIKIDSSEAMYKIKFSDASNNTRLSTAYMQFADQLLKIILEPIIYSIFLIAFGLGTYGIFKSESLTTLPILLLAALKAFLPMQQVSNASSRIESNSPSVEMIEIFIKDLHSRRKKKNQRNENKNLLTSETKPLLNLIDVDLEFDNSPLISGISLDIKRGKFYTIEGKSGCGKSSIMDMMMGFKIPSKGKIKIMGKSRSEIDMDQYYKLISHVPQETKLFHDNIVNNIIMEKRFDKERWDLAVHISNLSEVINSHDIESIDSIGVRGSKLSGGQKQRIAVARAIYKKPKLIFLDEYNSALDQHTDEIILERIKNLISDVAIVCISHRRYVSKYSDIRFIISNKELTIINN